MSSILNNLYLNNSVAPNITNKCTSRPRSATISVPPDYNPKSSVHVSVSVSVTESLASISAWASQIVPGTPPTSPSPRRSSFYSLSPKTPSRSPKSYHRRSLSATFLNFWDLPSAQPQTPAPKAVSPADLLAQGYTSIFVHLPSKERGSEYAESIPESPSPYNKSTKPSLFLPRAQPRTRTKSVSAEKTEDKPVTINRLRSFSFKGKKSKAPGEMGGLSVPPMPALPSHTSSARPISARPKSNHSKKPMSTPQSRYAAVLGPGGGTGALPLAQEVALSQMLDGGSLDANVRRVTERHARAAGTNPKSSSSAREDVYRKDRKDRRPIERREGLEQDGKPGTGVSGVYRDAGGNLWWDEDEALEFAGLLPPYDGMHQSHNGRMPLSNSNVHNQEKEKRRGLLPRLKTSAKPPPTTALPEPPNWSPLHSPVATGNFGRKGSASSASSPDTEGDDPDLDPAYAVRPRDPSTLFAAGYSMNAEKERHLRRAPHGIEAFGVSPLETSSNASNSGARERRERRRPAPLTLPLPLPTPHVPATGSTSAKTTSRPPTALSPPPPLPSLNALQGPTRAESEGRQEFFASAFAPPPELYSQSTSPPQDNSRLTTKASRRSSLTVGLSSLGLGIAGKVGRRASVASASPTSPSSYIHNNQAYLSAYGNAMTRGGAVAGNKHPPLSKTSSRPSTAAGTGSERSLKPKASRSRLAGFFKRG